MSVPRAVMISLWRNDADRRIKDRADRLLSKTHPNMRWLWLVGDSGDRTWEALRNIHASACGGKEVDIFRYDTGIVGEDPQTRRRRLSLSVNETLNRVLPDDEFVVWHESDLISPPDIVERLIGTGKCPVAGWPILHTPGGIMFYDIFAYRKDGVKFSNLPPYHECYRPDRPFTVDSVGSVWMFHAMDARAGVRCFEDACVELCTKLRGFGREIWVDPSIPIVQPADLWVPTGQ